MTAISDEDIKHHFDIYSPEFASDPHALLRRARELCPVAHSDRHGGYWYVTRYDDVLAVAQDWKSFSSASGITVTKEGEPEPPPMTILPVTVDPPVQRTFKRLINAYFTAGAVAPWEEATAALTHRLIDGFIEKGSCDFMADFARPLPGLAFFDLALHAPADDLQQVNEWATKASSPIRAVSQEANMSLAMWIAGLIEQRKAEGPKGDVVDAVISADIDGRPIAFEEAIGTIHLLVLGGLETTAGVLGMAMIRFCENPEILDLLRREPELLPSAVEELLRLDGSFVHIGRTARAGASIAGCPIPEGDRVVMFWSSANRDEREFDDPDSFRLDRARNRHLAFGAGPHRCAGSNLARMNLRVALSALASRITDVAMEPGFELEWHSTNSRAPLALPITFRAL